MKRRRIIRGLFVGLLVLLAGGWGCGYVRMLFFMYTKDKVGAVGDWWELLIGGGRFDLDVSRGFYSSPMNSPVESFVYYVVPYDERLFPVPMGIRLLGFHFYHQPGDYWEVAIPF